MDQCTRVYVDVLITALFVIEKEKRGKKRRKEGRERKRNEEREVGRQAGLKCLSKKELFKSIMISL